MNFLSVLSPAEPGLGVWLSVPRGEPSGSARAQLVLKFSRVASLPHTWEGNSACVDCIGCQICIAVSMMWIRLCQGWAVWQQITTRRQVQLWLLWPLSPHLTVPFLIRVYQKVTPWFMKIVSVDFLNSWKEITSLCHLTTSECRLCVEGRHLFCPLKHWWTKVVFLMFPPPCLV